MKDDQSKVTNSELRVTDEQLDFYRGIRSQDGWETLELTIRANHPETSEEIIVLLQEEEEKSQVSSIGEAIEQLKSEIKHDNPEFDEETIMERVREILADYGV